MKPNPDERPAGEGAQQDAHYFDDEATILARPVVPLEEVGGESAAPTAAPTPAGVDEQAAAPPAQAQAEPAPPGAAASPRGLDAPLSRREPAELAGPYGRPQASRGLLKSVPMALVVVAILAGVVIGGAGFYVFQRSLRPEPPAPAGQMTEQSPAAEPAEQQPPQGLPQETAEVAPAAVPPAPEPADADDADEDEAEAAPAVTARPRERAKEESGDKREGRAADARDDDSKRGGRRDEEDAPRARRDGGAPADDRRPTREQAAEARRVDSIVYRREQRRAERREQRRAERRERRAVDSVRSIFEGQP